MPETDAIFLARGKRKFHWTDEKRGSFEQQPKILRKGTRHRLVLDNRTGDAHPLHLHRNTFELTKVNGRRTAGIRKGVVLVKGYQTVEVDFTPRQEGLTLFHCHQQLHMDHGFKMLFNVES